MNILVACEESQEVCKAFRYIGHTAFSCDLLTPSGDMPQYHIMQDVIPLLDGHCTFSTMDRISHKIENTWDMIIAFPPCTDLAASGARWFEEKIKDGRQQKSIEFFMKFANANCKQIAIENPIGIMSTKYRKPDQIIQPWMFGHGEVKATCLWLKGLPPLIPTNIVDGRYPRVWLTPPGPNRARERSKTYHGIALAMAQQWGNESEVK